MWGQYQRSDVRAERAEARPPGVGLLSSSSRVQQRHLSIAYAVASIGITTAVAAYTFGTPHMLHYPSADIWQHLAAINAIAEHPLHPTNPFVESSEPSRLFGPLWVLIGTTCSIFGLTALQGFWLGGVVNLILLFSGIWLLGTSLLDGPKGAIALLAAMLGGWIYPVNFTGYHDPLTLLCSAAYPAITAVGCSLILWGLSLRWLRGSPVGFLIAITVALASITHPMGMAVGLAGCLFLALFGSATRKSRRTALIGLLIAGAAAASLWPYFSPLDVLVSATQPTWGAGIDFYSVGWIGGSIFPAILGLPCLFRREMRPFLLLLALCTVGFAVGATSYFVAGHRLLSWIALLLQIGLADALLVVFRSRSRRAIAAQAVALSCVTIQAAWTVRSLETIRKEAERQGNLLSDAREVVRNAHGGFAGYLGATFPLTALGQRVLSTPYAEPLVSDMTLRQAVSKRLFEIRDRDERIATARAFGVRYLVADRRVIPPEIAAVLSRQARTVVQSGNLVRFQLY